MPFFSSLGFLLSVLSPFGVGGEEPDAEALSPEGGTPVSPWRPPKSLASTAAHRQADVYLATLPRRPASPRSARCTISCLLPAGRARSHFLAPKPVCADVSPSHRASCLLASRQTLNWEEAIRNIWGAHLRVGSRPHGAWRKWQYMQLCHFLG